jgi:hypothetical protein
MMLAWALNLVILEGDLEHNNSAKCVLVAAHMVRAPFAHDPNIEVQVRIRLRIIRVSAFVCGGATLPSASAHEFQKASCGNRVSGCAAYVHLSR